MFVQSPSPGPGWGMINDWVLGSPFCSFDWSCTGHVELLGVPTRGVDRSGRRVGVTRYASSYCVGIRGEYWAVVVGLNLLNLKADWDAPRGLDWCPSMVVVPGMVCFDRGWCNVDSGGRVLRYPSWQGLT